VESGAQQAASTRGVVLKMSICILRWRRECRATLISAKLHLQAFIIIKRLIALKVGVRGENRARKTATDE
jgi:hypothetical protein